jgi:hypothetical protein
MILCSLLQTSRRERANTFLFAGWRAAHSPQVVALTTFPSVELSSRLRYGYDYELNRR